MAGDPDLAIGGRFELGERVGRGAFGEVFRAIDRSTGQVVAIKRLLAHQDHPLVIDRFEREARLLARLDNPYVVGYVAHGHDANGRPCIALEWLDGEDLAHRQRRQALSGSEAVDAVRQAALGLHALHNAGIVHRDVKPSNFYLASPADAGPAGLRLKLLDLGIARATTEIDLTLEGVRIGTPSYMSPEQARGEDAVTARSDLFSLGVVLYELLAGQRPFAGDQSLVVLAKIVLHEPPPIDDVAIDVPPEIVAIVKRAMSKSPDDRFASAFELAQALASAPPATRVRRRMRSDVAAQNDAPTTVQSTTSAVSATREQRVVTAVFAGFADTREPEKAMEAFARIAAAQGGVTHKTLGWRMIAVFGVPRSMGDEAVRAARTALGASGTIEGLQLAIATGRAIAGEGGLSAEAIERGAAKVRAGGIAVDAPTARLVAQHFQVEQVDGAEGGAGARGRSEYILRGERVAIRCAGPRLLGRETTTVGRDRELAGLEATLDEAIGEPVARAVLVTAPAGAGKSRVRFELLRRAAERDPAPTVLLARGDSLRAGSPFGMITELIRQAAAIVDGDSPYEQAAKLGARVARHVPADQVPRVNELLAEIAGVPAGVPSPMLVVARRDPILMGDAKRAAWEDWLEAESLAQPVLLVFDDLHWGDLPTVSFVDSALRRLRDRPIMVLALARPEVHEQFPRLWAERGVEEVRLGGLTRKASEKLVREVLGAQAADEVVTFILDRADGNAFYLEELIRAAAEGTREVPDTVLGMVQARLDALGAECKLVLRAASVFGRTFTRAGVAHLCGGEARTAGVVTALEELQAREVVTQRPSPAGARPGSVEYVFRQAVVREAAYAMLPDEDRALGHRLAGAWLEAAGASDATVLAEHYDRGGEPHKAVGWYRRGAEDALHGNDFAAAVARAERAVACGAEGALLGELRLIQAEAHRWAGRTTEAFTCAEEATGLLPAGEGSWFRAIGELCVVHGRRGDYAELEVIVAYVGEVACKGDQVSAQIAALCPAAGQLIQAGRYATADAAYERMQTLLRSSGVELDRVAQARLAQFRAFRATRHGDLTAARQGYREAAATFEAIGNTRNACIDRINYAFACTELGDVAEAESVLRQAVAASLRMALFTVHAYAELNLGRVLTLGGRLDEARTVELSALASGKRVRSPRVEGAARLHLSNIFRRAGDHVFAEQEARAAQELLTVAPPLRAGALAALARALLALGRVGEALAPASEAREIVSRGQRDMFDTMVRLTFAEALAAAGQDAPARAALEEAWRELHRCLSLITDAATREAFLQLEDNARTLELARAAGLVAEADSSCKRADAGARAR